MFKTSQGQHARRHQRRCDLSIKSNLSTPDLELDICQKKEYLSFHHRNYEIVAVQFAIVIVAKEA